ncbi:unnamed protein product [Cyprideis torosa]|uniref:Uncharacterized protein n=1 Tax=Cyprideis torosa TaxID=163714 RepID=A0A7R8WDG3_9CRUS|nr:unnamed protein product [Cyprideis torosa]CAG0888344.1 unnamed protein product [Cyprideis torosa]
MQYHSYAFSSNGEPTILARNVPNPVISPKTTFSQLFLVVIAQSLFVSFVTSESSTSHPYIADPPPADNQPNDIYRTSSSLLKPTLPRNARLLYPNLGTLKDFIKDPERADYIIKPRNFDTRPEINEIQTPEKVNLKPITQPLPPVPSRRNFRPPSPQPFVAANARLSPNFQFGPSRSISGFLQPPPPAPIGGFRN